MQKLFISARVGISDFDVPMNKILFPFCILTLYVNSYVSRQEKVKIGEAKAQVTQVLYY